MSPGNGVPRAGGEDPRWSPETKLTRSGSLSPTTRDGSTASLVVAAGVAVLVLTLTILALDFGAEARRAPLIVGIPTSVIAVIQVAAQVHRRRRATTTSSPDADGSRRALTIAVAWVIFVAMIFVLFGFLAAAIVAPPLLMRIHGKESWPVILLTTGGLVLISYVLLVLLLNAPLYHGLFSVTEFL